MTYLCVRAAGGNDFDRHGEAKTECQIWDYCKESLEPVSIFINTVFPGMGIHVMRIPTLASVRI